MTKHEGSHLKVPLESTSFILGHANMTTAKNGMRKNLPEHDMEEQYMINEHEEKLTSPVLQKLAEKEKDCSTVNRHKKSQFVRIRIRVVCPFDGSPGPSFVRKH